MLRQTCLGDGAHFLGDGGEMIIFRDDYFRHRMISLRLKFFILTVLCIFITSYSESTRNAAEEAICQPFLTSYATSPLNARVQRNLTVDEDGEFSCLLVLQDVNLPMQIRVTIHEGLMVSSKIVTNDLLNCFFVLTAVACDPACSYGTINSSDDQLSFRVVDEASTKGFGLPYASS